MSPLFNIIAVGKAEIAQVSQLFDQYRQFYQQQTDIKLAKNFITARMANKSSTIFMAIDNNNKALGFCQLYTRYCSIDATAIIILYDLFVDKNTRNKGIGKALMLKAKEHATAIGASRLDLETAKTNIQAQKLYQALGYQRECEYYKYSLEL